MPVDTKQCGSAVWMSHHTETAPSQPGGTRAWQQTPVDVEKKALCPKAAKPRYRRSGFAPATGDGSRQQRTGRDHRPERGPCPTCPLTSEAAAARLAAGSPSPRPYDSSSSSSPSTPTTRSRCPGALPIRIPRRHRRPGRGSTSSCERSTRTPMTTPCSAGRASTHRV